MKVVGSIPTAAAIFSGVGKSRNTCALKLTRIVERALQAYINPQPSTTKHLIAEVVYQRIKTRFENMLVHRIL